MPTFSFSEPTKDVEEEAGEVSVKILRTGDTTRQSSVRCYTRQNTAHVMKDFVENPNTEKSTVHFNAGKFKTLLLR